MSDLAKKALHRALTDLLRTKPLDKITVSQLSEQAGVSRMTFYYHFHDIYDLVAWVTDEATTQATASNRLGETWQQGLAKIFEAIEADFPFFSGVLASTSRQRVERYLYDVTSDLLLRVIDEDCRGELAAVSEEDRQFIAGFYKYSFVGLILQWIESDMAQDPADIVRRVDAVMAGNFRRALQASIPPDTVSVSSQGRFPESS